MELIKQSDTAVKFLKQVIAKEILLHKPELIFTFTSFKLHTTIEYGSS
jgi:hypothetical protein